MTHEDRCLFLEAKLRMRDNELSIVKWYIDVFEDGQDTRELAKLYGKLKKKHNDLKQEHMNVKQSLEKKLFDTREQLAEALAKVT